MRRRGHDRPSTRFLNRQWFVEAAKNGLGRSRPGNNNSGGVPTAESQRFTSERGKPLTAAVSCPCIGCEWTGTLAELREHLKENE